MARWLLFLLLVSSFVCVAEESPPHSHCEIKETASNIYPQNLDIVVQFPTENSTSVLFVFLDLTTTGPQFKQIAAVTLKSMANIHENRTILVIAIGPKVSVQAAAYILNAQISRGEKTVLAVAAHGAQATERAAAAAILALAATRVKSVVVDCQAAKLPFLFSTDIASVLRLNNWVFPLAVRSHWTESVADHVVYIKASTAFNTITELELKEEGYDPDVFRNATILQIPTDCPELEEKLPNIVSMPLQHPFDVVGVVLAVISTRLVETGYSWGTASAVKWLTCVKTQQYQPLADNNIIEKTKAQQQQQQQQFPGYYKDTFALLLNCTTKGIQICWAASKIFYGGILYILATTSVSPSTVLSITALAVSFATMLFMFLCMRFPERHLYPTERTDGSPNHEIIKNNVRMQENPGDGDDD